MHKGHRYEKNRSGEAHNRGGTEPHVLRRVSISIPTEAILLQRSSEDLQVPPEDEFDQQLLGQADPFQFPFRL